MKTSHPGVAGAVLAGILVFQASSAAAALPDYGLISAAGAWNATTQWAYDNSPVSVSGTGYSAGAVTDYGINQATSGTTSNTLAYAGSLWWDRYTISGGTGAGSASFSAALDGYLSASGLASAGVGYVLAISTTLPASFDIDFTTLSAGNAEAWLADQLAIYGGQNGAQVLASHIDSVPEITYVNGLPVPVTTDKTIDLSFTGSFGFTYDTPFYIGALLLTGAGGNSGTSDFYNTATFDLTLAQGDTLAVASVPEPGEWAMLLVGLGLVGLRLRARRTPRG